MNTNILVCKRYVSNNCIYSYSMYIHTYVRTYVRTYTDGCLASFGPTWDHAVFPARGAQQ